MVSGGGAYTAVLHALRLRCDPSLSRSPLVSGSGRHHDRVSARDLNTLLNRRSGGVGAAVVGKGRSLHLHGQQRNTGNVATLTVNTLRRAVLTRAPSGDRASGATRPDGATYLWGWNDHVPLSTRLTAGTYEVAYG
jgi:hypothetical protein